MDRILSHKRFPECATSRYIPPVPAARPSPLAHGSLVLSIPRALKSIEALKAGAPAVLSAYAKNETSDPRALRTLQDERLRRLVLHASEHIPFWKRRFARYGI